MEILSPTDRIRIIMEFPNFLENLKCLIPEGARKTEGAFPVLSIAVEKGIQ